MTHIDEKWRKKMFKKLKRCKSREAAFAVRVLWFELRRSRSSNRNTSLQQVESVQDFDQYTTNGPDRLDAKMLRGAGPPRTSTPTGGSSRGAGPPRTTSGSVVVRGSSGGAGPPRTTSDRGHFGGAGPPRTSTWKFGGGRPPPNYLRSGGRRVVRGGSGWPPPNYLWPLFGRKNWIAQDLSIRLSSRYFWWNPQVILLQIELVNEIWEALFEEFDWSTARRLRNFLDRCSEIWDFAFFRFSFFFFQESQFWQCLFDVSHGCPFNSGRSIFN